MFYEWVTKGAEIATVTFFALGVFALYCGAVLGMIAMVGRVFGFGGKNEKGRPY